MKFKFAKLPGATPISITKDDVDPNEFAMGLKVESEHSTDPEIQEQIALKHLEEDPHYYSKGKESGLFTELLSYEEEGIPDNYSNEERIAHSILSHNTKAILLSAHSKGLSLKQLNDMGWNKKEYKFAIDSSPEKD